MCPSSRRSHNSAHGVVPSDPRLSYEELAAENAVLRSMVEALRAQVAELTARLGQNSQNSSKPPSSDSPFAKGSPHDYFVR
jgi:transposase